MNLRLLGIVNLLTGACSVAFAGAYQPTPEVSNNHFYFVAKGGYTKMETLKPVAAGVTFFHTYKGTYNFFGAVGYQFKWLRAEVEAGWSNIVLDKLSFTTPGRGTVSQNGTRTGDYYTLMANALYDIKYFDKFIPYVGGGIGFSKTYNNNGLGDFFGFPRTSWGQSWAWQILAGIQIPLINKVSGIVEYKFFKTFKEVELNQIDTTNLHYRLASNSVNIGVKVDMD